MAEPTSARFRAVRYVDNNAYGVNPRLSRRRGFGGFMMSPQSRRPAIAAATRGVFLALAISPRSESDGDHYADHFHVDAHSPPVLVRDRSYVNPRVGARIVNTSDHAAAVEFGNSHARRHHRVLGRVGAQLGDYNP